MNPATRKTRKDSGMEGAVARWYAANTGKSRAEFAALAQRVAQDLSPDAVILEIAPGPGYFAIALAERGFHAVHGLDLSHTFVGIARANAEDAGVQVDFRQGNAADLPFAGDSFDFLFCRAAFKNFGRPLRALQEMRRVLKPGGRGLIIDLRKDASMAEIRSGVTAMNLGAVNRLATNLVFRLLLLPRAYTKGQFAQMLAEAGFHDSEIRTSGIGLEIALRK